MLAQLFKRNGAFKPIKALITITWFLLVIVFSLFIVAIYDQIFNNANHIELIQAMFSGMAGLIAQLTITLGADIFNKKKGEKI